MNEMNMPRSMGCKIWIACQDQRYERIMEVGMIMDGGCVRDISSEHMDGWKKSEHQDQRGTRMMNDSMEGMHGRLVWMELAPSVE